MLTVALVFTTNATVSIPTARLSFAAKTAVGCRLPRKSCRPVVATASSRIGRSMLQLVSGSNAASVTDRRTPGRRPRRRCKCTGARTTLHRGLTVPPRTNADALIRWFGGWMAQLGLVRFRAERLRDTERARVWTRRVPAADCHRQPAGLPTHAEWFISVLPW